MTNKNDWNKLWAYLRHVGAVTDASSPEDWIEDYYEADYDYTPRGIARVVGNDRVEMQSELTFTKKLQKNGSGLGIHVDRVITESLGVGHGDLVEITIRRVDERPKKITYSKENGTAGP